MCGLFASSKKLNTSEISNILKRLDSRGPDDTKVRSNSMGTYIFSRLEITGRDTTYMQPLEKTNSDKKDFFLFNGEIYNYKEIKKKFKLSYKKFTSGISFSGSWVILDIDSKIAPRKKYTG